MTVRARSTSPGVVAQEETLMRMHVRPFQVVGPSQVTPLAWMRSSAARVAASSWHAKTTWLSTTSFRTSYDTDDLVNAPACTCDTPQAVGVAQAQVEGLTRLDVFLNRFVSACDGDGDLFLDCTRPGCCADMPAEAIGDCDDVPRDCPDGRCHGRNAHL